MAVLEDTKSDQIERALARRASLREKYAKVRAARRTPGESELTYDLTPDYDDWSEARASVNRELLD